MTPTALPFDPSVLPPVPIPPDDDVRLAALQRYDIVDTDRDPAFDRITEMATRIFNVPIALVSLVAEDRQWFKSTCGLDETETPRGHAFCSYTVFNRRPLVIEDASRDPRFAANPLVTGPPHIRFYAGAPLMTPDGQALGSLCLIDSQARSIDTGDLFVLEQLADLVMDEMELRLALQDARRANGERIELVATVTHEVRNPLTAALGLAEILASDDGLGVEARALAGMIRESVRDADQIIGDLLMLSRLDRDSFEIDTRSVDVAHEVNAVLSSFDDAFWNRVVFDRAVSANVEADPLRFRQILRNLLSNAERYGGHSVSVQVIPSSEITVVEVVDDGPGVDPETEIRLFQSFSRGHAGRSHEISSGLGLAVSRRLAEAMGGHLTYLRRGESTVFTLALPASG